MLDARVSLPDLQEMFRLGEALDCPVDLVHVAGVAKATFSAALSIMLQLIR
jgi:hypothetical protein